MDKLGKHRQLNITPPPTKHLQFEVVVPKNTNKHIQADYRALSLNLDIPHGFWTHGSYTKSYIYCDVYCEHIILIDWVYVNKSKLGKNHIEIA